MGRRAAWLLAITALCLGLATAGLVGVVQTLARHAVDDLVARRLEAVGTTARRLLGDGADAGAALADVAAANDLDAAYVVDERFVVVADARGGSGRRANLLRLDADRLRAAFAGRGSVGAGFDLEGQRLLGGYFALGAARGATGGGRVLVLEAGERFVAPSQRLRQAGAGALATGAALVLLALGAIVLAARAAVRERVAYGQAERAGIASRLAAMVAHEVRNPLGIIRGAAELLRERLGVRPRERELADDILGETQRLYALTEEFLDLGRDVALQPATVELGPLVRDVCALVTLRAGAPRDWHVDAGGEVCADPAKLRQALLNLVLNAADATQAGGLVRIASERAGGGTRIVVEDDGPGVPAALFATLFEPFASGKANGTGLGLAIARRIFERHGGRLDYVPRPLGARFEGWLPDGREARA